MTGRGYGLPRGAPLLLAVAALVLHVCALDTQAHGTSDHMVSTTFATSDAGQISDLHSASCDGIKPGPSSAAPTMVTSRTLPDTSVGAISVRPTLGAVPAPVSRLPLFLLHASLLI